MKKLFIVVFLVICICTAILYIKFGNTLRNQNDVTTEVSDNVEEDIVEETVGEVVDAEVVDVADNEVGEEVKIMGKLDTSTNADKAAYFIDKLYDGEHNVCFSPLSLDMAIALVNEGADGMTNDVLTDFLNKEDYATFAKEYIGYMNHEYRDEDKTSVLQICNSLWGAQDTVFREEYIQDLKENFDADVFTVDFKNALTPGQMNNWISNKTGGNLKNVIANLEPNMRTMLINAVYLEESWIKVWRPFTGTFTRFDGASNDFCDMLVDDSLYDYYENDNAIAFGKDYTGGLKFIGVLPKKSGDFSLERLDLASLLESHTTDYEVHAIMPKLDFTSNARLTSLLQNSGLAVMFGLDCDLSRMSEEPLRVSDVVQACMFQLDENGTKAAAVTVVSVMRNSAFQPEMKEVKEVICDRPFAFLIYDETSGEILFAGKVVTVLSDYNFQ